MKKKLLIIIAVVIFILIVVTGVIYYIYNAKNNNEGINTSKLSNIYDKMISSNIYTVTMTLDENNKIITSRKYDVAYVDIYNNGEHTTNVVKDGNMYFLMHDTKNYYVYLNNNIELSKLTNTFEELISMENTKGKEKINNNIYNYEEFKDFYGFIFNYDKNVVNQNVRTRFYFKGDKLEYINTISDNNEELLKVEISYKEGQSSLYEIPTDYKEKK